MRQYQISTLIINQLWPKLLILNRNLLIEESQSLDRVMNIQEIIQLKPWITKIIGIYQLIIDLCLKH